ncbi:hypothetical protein HNR51_001130 [Methylorubrum thiocyanatum]|uniref:Uncharacterized protein n=1 Tax=Methylorubrum thiocyanatum TaxID=47958 RepID=A0AA40VB43_9HYPH|nr:hypothetical protein [Methylorubrum thiocyanatum]GJE79645.1 hypothetical protein CJNNKLLH_0971 [Methylorubrum thiocyanatum]
MSAALPFPRSRGLTRVIARPTFPLKVTVLDDSAGRPHSCRSRGTLVVRRCPAADTPLVGVSPKDLAAPVPTGAVLSSGRLFYQHSRLRRQAQSGCALAYAFLFFLPKHFDQPSTRIVSHVGLTECGQNWRAVA